ncbi:MAG: alkaline phosphatase family protein [Myxococcaceae bacterium]
MNTTPRSALLLLALLVAPAAVAKPAKLALIITVDALSSDVLLRARPYLRGGLAELLKEGAYFPYARYEYALPMTAAGHTTLSSGANPWRHGIVTNKLYSRSTGKMERAFADANHPVLDAPLGPDDVSPENILAETLADRLRMFTQGRGKAIAISEKARGAIPLAGRLGQAFWFNASVGRFVTGTFFAKETPAWLKAFNERKFPDAYFGKEWTPLLPEKAYSGEDDRPFERPLFALGRAFPHPLTGGLTQLGPPFYQALANTPMMNEIVVQAARAALEAESLGRDDQPDLLAVSFSALDRVYHQFGPYSHEVQDTLFRLDRLVGELVTAAERAAGGKSNIVVVLAADHGGAPIPEEVSSAGMSATRLDMPKLLQALSRELTSKHGFDAVLGSEGGNLYLNTRLLAEKGADAAAVRKTAAAFLRSQPGVAAIGTREEIYGGQDPSGFGRALRLGFNAERSGDIILIPKPYVVLGEDEAATAHGAPYGYDQLVPLVFYGAGIRAGMHYAEAHPTDVAPTVSAALGMTPPAGAEGIIRPEVLPSR